MGAPFVRAVLDAAYLLALAAWSGSVLFGVFAAAPLASLVTDPLSADRLRRAILQRAFAWGATCGAIALPAGLGAPLSYPELRGPWIAVQAGLVLAATLAMLHGVNSLAAGPRGGQNETTARLRRSRWLGASVVAMLALLIVAFALRPTPTTTGIPEPTPRRQAHRTPEIRPDGSAVAPGPRPSAAPGTMNAEP